MKALNGLLALGLVLAAVIVLVWWLLDRGSALAPWLVAAVLVGHGWVHMVFLMPAGASGDDATDNPFDMDRSWLISGGLDGRLVRAAGTTLAVVTFLALAAAALAVLGWLVPQGWWDGLTVVGVVGSTALLVLFWAPTLVLGLVINAALLALALQSAWQVPR